MGEDRASQNPSDVAAVALDVWLDFLGRADGEDDTAFQQLCDRCPDLAIQLGSLRSNWKVARSAPAADTEGDKAFLERLRFLGNPLPRGTRFRRESEIARGGMGVVHRVHDIELDRQLALKEMIVRPASRHPAEGSRFLEEAQITAQLDHPGIVPIHEVGMDGDGGLYFAMKLVQGRDLKAILDCVRGEREGWTQARALGVILKVCEAMAYAHSKHVIHRDLKPSNVMVGRFGEVYVMDWGLARVFGSHENDGRRAKDPTVTVSLETARKKQRRSELDPLVTLDGTTLGTPCYMPPEQARGEINQLSTRSDVYSIGAILYHLLTGEAPYVPSGAKLAPMLVLWRVIEGPPKPVTEFGREIPPELVAIQEKAMARDPADRYADTGELGADLRAFLEQRVVGAYQTGAIAELVKWTQRNRPLAAALVSIVILLVVGLGASLALKRKADHNEAEAKEQQRVAEAQKDDLSRLSALQRVDDLEEAADRLWPVAPELVKQYDAWLAEANGLLAELEPGRDGRYLGHNAKLRELESHASSPTEDQREESRRANPRYGELLLKRLELARSRQARDARTPRSGPASVPDLGALPGGASELCDLAWPLVDPERTRFSQEPRGLALVQRATPIVENEAESMRASEVLAWALLANGRDEEAMAELRAAFAASSDTSAASLRATLGRVERESARLRRLLSDLPALEQETAELEAALGAVDLRFEHAEDRWWHDQLQKLVSRLEGLREPRAGLIDGCSKEHSWGVRQRMQFAASLVERTLTGAEARKLWSEACASISDRTGFPLYDGLRIEPQLGLLPLGADPHSHLWEFADLASGEPALRADGQLRMTEATGLVLVLLPGGRFWMGAQSADPRGVNYDANANTTEEGPAHEVVLSPFFISKYEMTQGQWKRLAGWNPSTDNPDTYQLDWSSSGKPGNLLHPVETVSWWDCHRLLGRFGLVLPSEAQWEYAARGGTATPWWCGSRIEDLQGVANLNDLYAEHHGRGEWGPSTPELDDGFTVHAPIGTFAPNAFGLHEVHGNLFEWCLDGLCTGFYRFSPERDPVCDPAGNSRRMFRGGGYFYGALFARVSKRVDDAPEMVNGGLGVRPARLVRRTSGS